MGKLRIMGSLHNSNSSISTKNIRHSLQYCYFLWWYVILQSVLMSFASSSNSHLPLPTAHVELFSFDRGTLKIVTDKVNTPVTLTQPTRYFELYMFQCNASFPVQWTYIGEGNPVTTADAGRFFKDFYDVNTYSYQSILLMYTLDEYQSGRYVCRGMLKEHDKQYVYFDLFVPVDGKEVLLSTAEKTVYVQEEKESAYIPCGVSDSTAEVALYKGNYEGTFQKVELNSSVTFNPRKGFRLRLPELKEPYGKYMCTAVMNSRRRKVNLLPQGFKIYNEPRDPLYEKIPVQFSYDYKYNRVLCCTGTSFVPKLSWAGCGSILDCQVKSVCFNEDRCEPRIGNAGYDPSKWIDPGPLPGGCSGWRLRDDPNGDMGMFKCATPGITQYQPYLLNRGNIFLDFETAPPAEAIMTLKRMSDGPAYVGSTVEFHCNGTRFYFGYGFRWAFQRGNGDIEFIEEDDVVRDRFFTTAHRRQTVFSIPHADIRAIVCFGPIVNHPTEWRTVSLPLVVEEEPLIVPLGKPDFPHKDDEHKLLDEDHEKLRYPYVEHEYKILNEDHQKHHHELEYPYVDKEYKTLRETSENHDEPNLDGDNERHHSTADSELHPHIRIDIDHVKHNSATGSRRKAQTQYHTEKKVHPHFQDKLKQFNEEHRKHLHEYPKKGGDSHKSVSEPKHPPEYYDYPPYHDSATTLQEDDVPQLDTEILYDHQQNDYSKNPTPINNAEVLANKLKEYGHDVTQGVNIYEKETKVPEIDIFKDSPEIPNVDHHQQHHIDLYEQELPHIHSAIPQVHSEAAHEVHKSVPLFPAGDPYKKESHREFPATYENERDSSSKGDLYRKTPPLDPYPKIPTYTVSVDPRDVPSSPLDAPKLDLHDPLKDSFVITNPEYSSVDAYKKLSPSDQHNRYPDPPNESYHTIHEYEVVSSPKELESPRIVPLNSYGEDHTDTSRNPYGSPQGPPKDLTSPRIPSLNAFNEVHTGTIIYGSPPPGFNGNLEHPRPPSDSTGGSFTHDSGINHATSSAAQSYSYGSTGSQTNIYPSIQTSNNYRGEGSNRVSVTNNAITPSTSQKHFPHQVTSTGSTANSEPNTKERETKYSPQIPFPAQNPANFSTPPGNGQRLYYSTIEKTYQPPTVNGGSDSSGSTVHLHNNPKQEHYNKNLHNPTPGNYNQNLNKPNPQNFNHNQNNPNPQNFNQNQNNPNPQNFNQNQNNPNPQNFNQNQNNPNPQNHNKIPHNPPPPNYSRNPHNPIPQNYNKNLQFPPRHIQQSNQKPPENPGGMITVVVPVPTPIMPQNHPHAIGGGVGYIVRDHVREGFNRQYPRRGRGMLANAVRMAQRMRHGPSGIVSDDGYDGYDYSRALDYSLFA